MSKLSSWAKKNPEIAAYLRRIILALFTSHTAADRAAILAEVAELDTDGDGVPDSEDAAPNNAAVTTRKKKVK